MSYVYGGFCDIYLLPFNLNFCLYIFSLFILICFLLKCTSLHALSEARPCYFFLLHAFLNTAKKKKFVKKYSFCSFNEITCMCGFHIYTMILQYTLFYSFPAVSLLEKLLLSWFGSPLSTITLLKLNLQEDNFLFFHY